MALVGYSHTSLSSLIWFFISALDDENSEDEDPDEDSESDFLDNHDDAEFSSSGETCFLR